MAARHGQTLGRVRKWLHSDALRRAGGDLTSQTLLTLSVEFCFTQNSP